MRIVRVTKIVSAVCVLVSGLVLGQPATVHAQTPAPQVGVNAEPAKPSLEIYGFAMLDIGHDFKQIHPDWYDTLRLTRLPKVENEFGEDNNTFMGVRQSRLGVRSYTPTDLGPLKTIFEFELFGTGVDSGQTTFRLRHAWGELGPIGAGQVPGVRSRTRTSSRTPWSTGVPPVFRGTATCSSATRRSTTVKVP